MVEESHNKFIHFKGRGDLWTDVQPLEQFEGGHAPISPIAYSSEYQEVMNYFRALFHKNEISERAFNLTTEAIKYNPGNYSAWFYRRRLLDELKKPLDQEMEYLKDIAIPLEKNYQIWHHRRCIMEIYQQNFEQEKQLLDEIFESDAKNYHAWSYRIWFVERFQLWDGEMQFVEKMLKEDVNNNSVWSYRFFILNKTCKELDLNVIKKEIDYVLSNKLKENFLNESAWVYMRGMLATTQDEVEKSKMTNAKKCLITDVPELKTECMRLISDDDFNKGNRFIYVTLIDYAVADADFEKALDYLELLKNIDKIRINYWKWRINEIKQILLIA